MIIGTKHNIGDDLFVIIAHTECIPGDCLMCKGHGKLKILKENTLIECPRCYGTKVKQKLITSYEIVKTKIDVIEIIINTQKEIHYEYLPEIIEALILQLQEGVFHTKKEAEICIIKLNKEGRKK